MSPFNGFPLDAFEFLAELTDNNEKAWFEANRARYQSMVLEPAVAFVTAVGQRLQSVAPKIRYDTRTNGSGSLMRIYRDTRFSKDKTPYKTNISGLWWEGNGKKMLSPAFGFQMNSKGMGLMAGQFSFDKAQLIRFRETVDSQRGIALQKAIEAVLTSGAYEVLGDAYKHVPRGYDADHPLGDLLKFKGLYAHPLDSIPAEALTMPAAVDQCMAHFHTMAPIQRWLADALL